MKRAMAIAAGGIALAAGASAQSGEYWTDPKTSEILNSRPVHFPTEDRFMLIGETATNPVETREIMLQCYSWTVRFNPVTRMVRTNYVHNYSDGHRSRATGDYARYIGFQADVTGRMHIDLEAMTFSLTHSSGVGTGTCTEVRP
jgi:hypothetical protein